MMEGVINFVVEVEIEKKTRAQPWVNPQSYAILFTAQISTKKRQTPVI